MNMKRWRFWVATFLLAGNTIYGQIKTISSDSLKTLILDCKVGTDYVLLDVREQNEVVDGIIASEVCKPYHMALNSGVLENNYSHLPDDIPIYIYCRSGNRSREAATFLSNNGFTDVYSMSGGINSYSGTLYDSTEFKTLNILPEPSFMEAHCPLGIRNSRAYRISRASTEIPQVFTLQGRRIVTHQSSGRHMPLFIITRYGRESMGMITGLDRNNLKR